MVVSARLSQDGLNGAAERFWRRARRMRDTLQLRCLARKVVSHWAFRKEYMHTPSAGLRFSPSTRCRLVSDAYSYLVELHRLSEHPRCRQHGVQSQLSWMVKHRAVLPCMACNSFLWSRSSSRVLARRCSYSCSRARRLPRTLRTLARGVFRAYCVLNTRRCVYRVPMHRLQRARCLQHSLSRRWRPKFVGLMPRALLRGCELLMCLPCTQQQSKWVSTRSPVAWAVSGCVQLQCSSQVAPQRWPSVPAVGA